MTKFRIVLLSTVFGCAVPQRSDQVRPPGVEFPKTVEVPVAGMVQCSLVALLANPLAYDGLRVRTVGFLLFNPEGADLFLSEADAESRNVYNAVELSTLYFRTHYSGLSGRYVEIEGYFSLHSRNGIIGTISRISYVLPVGSTAVQQ